MKILLSALLMLTLAACGFTPMYGSGTGSSGVSAPQGLDRVEISLIQDQPGVYLRNILIDRFYQDGYPQSPAYRLDVDKIRETETSLDVTVNSETTRKQVKLRTRMTLADKASGEIVLTRDLIAVTSYNILGSQFTTHVSEADAREAALSDLARQIENHVALFFKR